MFTVQLKNLFFKQNITNLETLLADQASTYVILRYAHDIPSAKFTAAIEFLVENIDEITDKRLINFVNEYIKATGVGLLEFTDEYDYSVDLIINTNPDDPFGECPVSYDFGEE